MGRIRTIKPEAFVNEQLGALEPLCRWAFMGLLTQADREGRLEDRPSRLKVQILPYDEAPMDAVLEELADAGLLVRYEADGKKLIQITNFGKHQRPNHREVASTLPGPDTASPGKTRARPGKTRIDPGEIEGNRKGNRKGRSDSSLRSESPASAADAAPAEPAPPFLTFPTNGDRKTWDLTRESLERLRELYPGIDVEQEARNALGWCEANPTRRKTWDGMPRFLDGWLKRAQNRAPRLPAGASPPRAEPAWDPSKLPPAELLIRWRSCRQAPLASALRDQVGEVPKAYPAETWRYWNQAAYRALQEIRKVPPEDADVAPPGDLLAGWDPPPGLLRLAAQHERAMRAQLEEQSA